MRRRFSPKLLENPHLARMQGASAVFLDTTYCNPRHTFPPQVCSVHVMPNVQGASAVICPWISTAGQRGRGRMDRQGFSVGEADWTHNVQVREESVPKAASTVQLLADTVQASLRTICFVLGH